MLIETITSGFLSEIMEHAGTVLGAGISGLVMYYGHKIHSWIKEYRKSKRNSITRLNSIDIIVYKNLAELLYVTRSDRAYVVLFHNGIYYNNSMSQAKMSCTHEMVAAGVSQERVKFQDLLISRYPFMINQLTSNKFLCLHMSDGDMDQFKQTLRERGVTSCIMCPMKNGEVIEGYVAVDFIKEFPHACEGVEDGEVSIIANEVISHVNKIGFILRNGNE